MNNKRLLAKVSQLISEGEELLETARNRHHDYADPPGFAQWLPGCRNLLRLLGDLSNPFSEPFAQSHDYYGKHRCEAMLGSLRAIEQEIKDGLLIRLESLVFASAFSDLLEQAEELANKGYLLASGVICRAIFEEHLRKLCDSNNCIPSGKLSIEPLSQALVKAGIFTALDAKRVTQIAGAGNHCAHNLQPALDEKDIRDLIRDVTDFMSRHQFA